MPLLSKAQLDGYLKRIGITDADAQALEPTLGTLQHIHRAHASSIPFETLSMSYEPAVQQWQGVPTSLDDVYTKLVRTASCVVLITPRLRWRTTLYAGLSFIKPSSLFHVHE